MKFDIKKNIEENIQSNKTDDKELTNAKELLKLVIRENSDFHISNVNSPNWRCPSRKASKVKLQNAVSNR
jgi:hypothetical protein